MKKNIIVELEALDKKPITERTGAFRIKATTDKIPQEGGYQFFFYVDKVDSPGVAIATDGIERIGNEIKFFDLTKRPFKMTILKS